MTLRMKVVGTILLILFIFFAVRHPAEAAIATKGTLHGIGVVGIAFATFFSRLVT